MIEDRLLEISEGKYRELDMPSYSLLSSISTHGIDVLGGELNIGFSLKFGSLVDDICFTPSVINDKYYRGSASTINSGNPKKIIDAVLANCNESSAAGLAYYEKEIIAAAKKLGVYAKYDDAKILSTILVEKNENYFKDKISSIGKIHIKNDMWEQAVYAANTLKTHPFTEMYFQDWENIQTIYQYKFVVGINGVMVKGMLDALLVNHEEKVVLPVDLKTGEVSSNDFNRSFLDYKYYLQASLYRLALLSIVESDPDLEGYTVADFEFVYLSKINLNKPVIKVVNQDLYEKGLNGFTDSFGVKHKGVYELLEIYKDYGKNKRMYESKVYKNFGRSYLEI